jgi:hypothetical protein
VLLVAAVLLYTNRHLIPGMNAVRDDAVRDDAGPAATGTGTTAAAGDGVWEPLTPAGAERARRAVQSLEKPSGPVFVKLRPGELASYVFDELARQLPASAEDVQASVRDGRVYVRTTVRLSDIGGTEALGPLASMLGDREPLLIGGRFNVIRPGLAQFRVEEAKLRDFGVPRAVLPRLIGRIRKNPVPEGVAGDALPVRVPESIADVRVSNGQIVLYKTAPQ